MFRYASCGCKRQSHGRGEVHGYVRQRPAKFWDKQRRAAMMSLTQFGEGVLWSLVGYPVVVGNRVLMKFDLVHAGCEINTDGEAWGPVGNEDVHGRTVGVGGGGRDRVECSSGNGSRVAAEREEFSGSSNGEGE